MKNINILTLLFVLTLPLGLSSCKTMMGGMMMSDKKPPPPARAPAHGRRAHREMHQYYYYPDHTVYYDIHDRLYFYLSDANWIMSSTLPHHYQLNDYRVSVKMESEIPYTKYQKHKKKYPKKHKQKHHKKSKKDKKHQ